MCQGCVDEGLVTQKVYDAIEAFSAKWPDSNYGPAQVVIDDANVEDDNIQWCLDHWEENALRLDDRDMREAEFEATKAFLRELLTWPIEERVGPKGL